MVFNKSLSDNKSSHISRTLLSILVNLDNAVVWMISAPPLISKSSRSCTNLLMTVPSEPVTNGITVTFMLHSIFQYSYKVCLLIGLFTYFQFCVVVSWDSKVHCSAGSFFVCESTIIRSGRLAEIRWSVSNLKSQKSLCTHFPKVILRCAYTIYSYGQI